MCVWAREKVMTFFAILSSLSAYVCYICVCLCVYVGICVYKCVYVCIRVYMCVNVHTCVCECVRESWPLSASSLSASCMHMCVYVCVRVYTCVYDRIRVYMCVYVCVRILVMYDKRDLCTTKETCVRQKRLVYDKRDLCTTKETCVRQKRPVTVCDNAILVVFNTVRKFCGMCRVWELVLNIVGGEC